jgi:hypothetical protein
LGKRANGIARSAAGRLSLDTPHKRIDAANASRKVSHLTQTETNGENMHKLAITTAAAFIALSAPSLAAAADWNVTEESASGIKSAQGTWTLKMDGDKFSGSAFLQSDNGAPLTYTLDGALKDGVYTATLSKRSDDKKGCVWTGHAQKATALGKSTGFIGDVACDGAKLVIRAIGM